jgi:hypothetical protein
MQAFENQLEDKIYATAEPVAHVFAVSPAPAPTVAQH